MSRPTPYWTTSTNLNRKKSQSQPAVKQSPKVSLYESVRTFLWKNPLKRNANGKVRNPHKADDEISNKISTRNHKRIKINENLLGQVEEAEENRFSDDDDGYDTGPELKNEVEIEDSDEEWVKEIEQRLKKVAKRRLPGRNLYEAEEPSEQVDFMNQVYNFFPRKCQIQSSKPPVAE